MKHTTWLTKLLYLLLLLGMPAVGTAQWLFTPEGAVQTALDSQQVAWNRGDLLGFMQYYQRTDSIRFLGRNSLTLGWDATLKNYRDHYTSKAAMGTLSFKLVQVQALAADACFTAGFWHLSRDGGDVGGCFSLLWRRINGRWLIITDHSS